MKKAWNVIKTVFSWIITIIAVCIMIFTVTSTLLFNRNDRNVFGYKFFIVQTDSMAATDFYAGDLVITKNVDPSTLEAGDIITFQSQNTESYGEIITHKIRSLTTDSEGNPGFITYGTTTDVDDETVVTYSFVLGQYQFHLSKVGTFFYFLKSTPGFIVCILVPFMILILIQGMQTIALFRQYKREQTEEIERERAAIAEEKARNDAQLAEEKARNEAMMAQLLAMQEQLKASGAKIENPEEQGKENE